MMGRRQSDAADEQLISEYLTDLSRDVPASGTVPSPSFIWWKAQLLRRLDAEREATAPIDVGDKVHVLLAILGAVALGIGGWSQLPFAASPIVAAVFGAGGFVLVTVLTFALIDAIRGR